MFDVLLNLQISTHSMHRLLECFDSCIVVAECCAVAKIKKNEDKVLEFLYEMIRCMQSF